MNNRQRKHFPIQGVTLLEVLFVLIIVAMLLMLGLRQYALYQNDAEIAKVKNNVDMLFQAMTLFFRANCNGSVMRQNYFPLYVSLNMLSSGYLQQSIVSSSLVNATKYDQGYLLQFNPSPAATAFKGVPIYTSTNTQSNRLLGYAQIWSIQVSVVLQDNTQIDTYKNLLAADCASSLMSASTNTVASCGTAPVSGNTFLVWERAPGFITSQAGSGAWISMPQLKAFTKMYRTYPILLLTGGSTYANQHYYVCGN